MEINKDVYDSVRKICAAAKTASASLRSASTAEKNNILTEMKKALDANRALILEKNALDIGRETGVLPDSKIDRLRLTDERIDGMIAGISDVIAYPDPVGRGERFVRPNGLTVSKIKVPLGVVAMIYESRPNVTVDSAALCVKTGNAVVLRGGKEAIESNRILVKVLKDALAKAGYGPDLIGFIDRVDRESSASLMKMRGLVDVLIPRGSAALIQSVVENSTVPTIETGAGNCHLYIDKSADLQKAVDIAVNAKLSRPAVCNAIETLLVHRDEAEKFLPAFAKATEGKLEIRGCPETRRIIDCGEATEEDYATEYDDVILAVKVVSGVEEAVSHIEKYSTGHSEAIVTEDLQNAEYFKNGIDSAAVYVNASTRFTDGGEFGYGAEIGISTQKLHIRGPMGADALTTDKYLIDGDGQIR